ncbi:MAG: response regulator transcription factor [Solobacterium sp.]|nr:response regulator transcription factor [Solobacterium sp.]
MNIAIVDDDFEFHKTLRAILAGHSFFGTIKDYYSGHDFLCACDAGSFDVVFLDVEMPGADGLNVAEQMRRKAMKSIVVFVTNHSETVFQAFGLNVISFVEKSKAETSLPPVLNQITTLKDSHKTYTFELKNNGIINLQSGDILFCEMSLRKLYLFTSSGKKHILRESLLSKIYAYINSSSFQYANRSCFVNIKKIRLLESDRLYLSDYPEPIYISRGKYKDIKHIYLDWLSSI